VQDKNETPRSKLRGISTKDISNNNAASSGVFTLRENKKRVLDTGVSLHSLAWIKTCFDSQIRSKSYYEKQHQVVFFIF
jgi:hypothetical protein